MNFDEDFLLDLLSKKVRFSLDVPKLSLRVKKEYGKEEAKDAIAIA